MPVNTTRRSEQQKEYREKHREFLLDYGKKYREENRETLLAKKKKYYQENLEMIKMSAKVQRVRHALRDKNIQLKFKFGITLEEYEKMLVEQNGVCAICGKDEPKNSSGKKPRLAVDHCHKTHKVRGLLCSSCNKGLGVFFDNKEYLRSAITYLEKMEKIIEGVKSKLHEK